MIDPATDANNVTDAVFGATPPPANLDALRADATFGNDVYTGPTFAAWQYVIVGDGSQAFYWPATAAWCAGAFPPASPYAGAVVADLATLRAQLGATATTDDDQLQRALDAATGFVYDRVWLDHRTEPDVQLAILMMAGKWYQRRKSPEGVAGFGAEGVLIRVLADDPDVRRMLERHVDHSTAGIG